jgi:hypothetical protein
MQSEWSNIFSKRLLVNGSKAVVRQLDRKSLEDKAKKFYELKPVYVLAVVNGNFSKGTDWYHHLQIMDAKNSDVVIEGLDYILLELPKFTRDKWTYVHKQLAVLWLRFLKEIDGYHDKLPDEFVSNELISRAIKICEASAFSREEMDAYDSAEMEAIWQNSIKGLEDEVVEGRKERAELNKTLAEKENVLLDQQKRIAELERQLKEK